MTEVERAVQITSNKRAALGDISNLSASSTLVDSGKVRCLSELGSLCVRCVFAPECPWVCLVQLAWRRLLLRTRCPTCAC